MDTTRDLLSLHETVSQFSGLQEKRCLYKTSLCPDRCNHGGTIAIFTILKYLKYDKPGKYGDARSKKYHIRSSEVGEHFKTVFDILKLDDYVLLHWNHDYVHRGGSSFPERPMTELKLITKEGADSMKEI